MKIFWPKYVFLALFTMFAFYHENKFKQKLQKSNKQKHVHFGKYTFIHCSRITVVHVYVNVFSKIHPACHIDANSIKPGSYKPEESNGPVNAHLIS